MALTTLAATAPRTNAIAPQGMKRRLPIAPHVLPNKAGQVGPHAKGGIVNNAMLKRK
jgi:hypothetical protein